MHFNFRNLNEKMARRKSIKMKEVETFDNVFLENGKDVGNEIKNFFENDNPITLEIGCGRGDYSIGLAQKFPERNFVGIDIKGERIWNGSVKADELGLKNVAFLISYADKLESFFSDIKISEIWVPFPDPHRKSKSENRRLVAPNFLKMYKKILKEGGIVNLKTDDDFLYEYTNEVVTERKLNVHQNCANIYDKSELSYEEEIQTKYEVQHLKDGKTIKLLRFDLMNLTD